MLGDLLKVYNGFHLPTPNEQQTPEEILEVFNRYAIGETNVTYKRFMFHIRKQEDAKSVEDFITALRC